MIIFRLLEIRGSDMGSISSSSQAHKSRTRSSLSILTRFSSLRTLEILTKSRICQLPPWRTS